MSRTLLLLALFAGVAFSFDEAALTRRIKRQSCGCFEQSNCGCSSSNNCQSSCMQACPPICRANVQCNQQCGNSCRQMCPQPMLLAVPMQQQSCGQCRQQCQQSCGPQPICVQQCNNQCARACPQPAPIIMTQPQQQCNQCQQRCASSCSTPVCIQQCMPRCGGQCQMNNQCSSLCSNSCSACPTPILRSACVQSCPSACPQQQQPPVIILRSPSSSSCGNSCGQQCQRSCGGQPICASSCMQQCQPACQASCNNNGCQQFVIAIPQMSSGGCQSCGNQCMQTCQRKMRIAYAIMLIPFVHSYERIKPAKRIATLNNEMAINSNPSEQIPQALKEITDIVHSGFMRELEPAICLWSTLESILNKPSVSFSLSSSQDASSGIVLTPPSLCSSNTGVDEDVISVTPAVTYTVHDAIEAAGFGKFQVILSIIGGFAWMADSMEVMLLSLLSPSLACEWGVTPFQQAISTTFVFAGWMISSPFWGRFCDVYGRKKGLISASLLGFIFGIVTAFTHSFLAFLLARFFVGLAVGGVPQSVTMTAEFLPFFWAIGAAVEAGIALAVMPTLGWRWLVGLSSVPLALFALSCWWLPESARFHVAHGKIDEARATLERVARYNKRQLPDGELIAESNHGSTRMSELLHERHRRTTVQLWVIWVLFGLLYYGITIYTTKLFQSGDECHGGVRPANVTSAGSGFAENSTEPGITNPGCRHLTPDDYLDIVITSFSELPGLFFTMILMETIGRRATFALNFGVYSACTVVLILCMSRTWIVALLFVGRAVMAGAFQTGYIYTAEVYPTTLRALGLGAAGGWARVGSMATPIVAQVLGSYNLIIPAIIYTCGGMLGMFTAMLLPMETKGRAMKEHQ
ncbi:hypothetical protein PRIPAC_79672 [Pristionchus pacificus]|uniref:Membrane transporter n=1 Tax=Pristionchus pacificus TaxID=54126 RepID=A0A2A6BWH9_PRIPA|nr:hypothetical protein PRIPAC_79672 [Pristionchus pacificus]|eukprot:PDM70270.1 membrane transporter [Pristionchus pacificus]